MISTIGIMLGLYIVTQMIALLTRTGDRAETLLVRILAVVTAAISVVCTLSLLIPGSEGLPLPGRGALKPVDTPASTSVKTVPLSAEPSFDPSHPIQLELSFTKDCWVEAIVDKTSRLAELSVQGETLRVSAEESISLTLGDAGAVSATLNGKPMNLGGKDGEMVRDLLIDSRSFVAGKPGPS